MQARGTFKKDGDEEARTHSKIKVIVGGATATKKFTSEIGVDGYDPDVASAVDLVKSLISKSKPVFL